MAEQKIRITDQPIIRQVRNNVSLEKVYVDSLVQPVFIMANCASESLNPTNSRIVANIIATQALGGTDLHFTAYLKAF